MATAFGNWFGKAPGYVDGWFGHYEGGASFPTQYSGIWSTRNGVRFELCLVQVADAPTEFGQVYKVRKDGTTYALYPVSITDLNASPILVNTPLGKRALRLKTES